MSDKLFKKIIDECSNYNMERIIPYLMNDPLTDLKIFQRLDYIRLKMPTVHIEFSTTANLLNRRISDRLLEAPITELRLSSFGITRESYRRFMPGVDYKRAMENIKYFIKKYHRSKPFKLVVIMLENMLNKKEENLSLSFWKKRGVEVRFGDFTSRGGLIDISKFTNREKRSNSNKNRKFMIIGCKNKRDTEWIHVLYNGDICLCCMDWKREVILGNVRESSIKDVWNSKQYNRIRNIIGGKPSAPKNFICKRCERYIH